MTLESLVMNALIAILSACVVLFCLIMLWVAIMRRRTKQGGKHRHGTPAVHRLGSSVAALREREQADNLRYYPGR
jgi:hypothetical protein